MEKYPNIILALTAIARVKFNKPLLSNMDFVRSEEFYDDDDYWLFPKGKSVLTADGDLYNITYLELVEYQLELLHRLTND